MLKVAFHTSQMSERGTEVALFDYARLNRDILGNESVVLFRSDNPQNQQSVISRFRSEFPTVGYERPEALDTIPRSEGCDLVYVIKHGMNDGTISKIVPTMVHAVFPTPPSEAHGASYAFVSRWLSDHCSAGHIPYVPHVVSMPDVDQDLRNELSIPEEATVFGCYGGSTNFDIDFVKAYVLPEVLSKRADVYFIFLNILKFSNDRRTIFLPGTADPQMKTRFVKTCDAMLHARWLGESFGLACGEFSLAGKPVITFANSPHRAHLQILGEDAVRYRGPRELKRILLTFDRNRKHRSGRETYLSQFNAPKVAEMFQKVLIEPALRPGAVCQPASVQGWMDMRYRMKEKVARNRRKLYRAF